ncbi:MAG: hypothetical protein WC300_06270, partial [Candidatus Omnitrophota bacterium]
VSGQTIATYADETDANLINVQQISGITYDSQDRLSGQAVTTSSRNEVIERLSISDITYDSQDRVSGQVVMYKTLDNSTTPSGSDIILIEEASEITYDNQDRLNAQTIVIKDGRGSIYQTRQVSDILYDSLDRISSQFTVISMDSQVVYKQQINNITYDNMGFVLGNETLTYNKNDKLIQREELLITSRDANHMESGRQIREWTASGVLKETRKAFIIYDQDTLRAKKTTTEIWKQNTLIRTEELVINRWDTVTGDIADQTTTIREENLVTVQRMYGIERDSFRQITAYKMDIAETAGGYTKTTHILRNGIQYYLGYVSEYRDTITSSLNSVTTNIHIYDMVYDLGGGTEPTAFKKTITESGAGYGNTTQISRTVTIYNDMGQAMGYTEAVSNLGVTTVSVYSNITYDSHDRMLTFRIDARANGYEIPAVDRTSTTYDRYGMLVAYSETRYGISCADILGFDTAGAYTTTSWSGVYDGGIGNLKSYTANSVNTAGEKTKTEVTIASRSHLGFIASEKSVTAGPGEDKDGHKVTETTMATTTFTYDASGRVSGKKSDSSSSNSKGESSTSHTETTITYSANGSSVATSKSDTNSSDGGQSHSTSVTTTYIDGSMLVESESSGKSGDEESDEFSKDIDDETGRPRKHSSSQPAEPAKAPDDSRPRGQGDEEDDEGDYTSSSTQKYDCLGTKRYYHSESQSTGGSGGAPYKVTETWDKFGKSLGKDESGKGHGGGRRYNSQDYEDYLEAAKRAGFDEGDLENLNEVDRLAIEYLLDDIEMEKDDAYEKANRLLDLLEAEGKSLNGLSGEERWAFQLVADGSFSTVEKAKEWIDSINKILQENGIDSAKATSGERWAAQRVKNEQSGTWDEALKWISAYKSALALQGTETAPVTEDNATNEQRLIAEIAADIMCGVNTISPDLKTAVDTAKKKVSDIARILVLFRTETGEKATIKSATGEQLSLATYMAGLDFSWQQAESYVQSYRDETAVREVFGIIGNNLTDYQRMVLNYALNDADFMSFIKTGPTNPDYNLTSITMKQEIMAKATKYVSAIRSY